MVSLSSRLTEVIPAVARALRAIGRDKTSTTTIILTLSVGLGFSSGMFAIVNASFLAAFPFPQPERLVGLVREDGSMVSPQIYERLRRAVAVEDVAIYANSPGWNMVTDNRGDFVNGRRVTATYFQALRLSPLRGRLLTPEDEIPTSPPAVVISERLWRGRFGSAEETVGRDILIDGVRAQILGVVPSSAAVGPSSDVWMPLKLSPRDNTWNYNVVARLRDGQTVESAQLELTAIRQQLLDTGRREFESARTLAWLPLRVALIRNQVQTVRVLFGAVLLLLVVACLNVANLQLLRNLDRRREFAARLAMGASPRHLFEVMLVEAMVLSGIATIGALIVAELVIRSAQRLSSVEQLALVPIHIDWRVIAFTCFLGFLAALIASIFPAWTIITANPIEGLASDSSRHSSDSRTSRTQEAFVVVQAAIAIVLLIGAALLVRTFVALQRIDLGFEPRNVLSSQLSMSGSSIKSEQQMKDFVGRLLAGVSALPGTAAAMSNNPPIVRGLNLPIEPPPGGLLQRVKSVDWRYVSDGYFDVLHIPLKSGRTFGPTDLEHSPPTAIVNESFQRMAFGNSSAIGKTIRLVNGLGGDPQRTIVGVVGNVKGASGALDGVPSVNVIAAPTAPLIYVPLAQTPYSLISIANGAGPATLLVRSGTPDVIAHELRAIVRRLQPDVSIVRVRPLTRIVESAFDKERLYLELLMAFAVVATALSALGLYGLVAHSSRQRRRELGIRLALGASTGQVVLILARYPFVLVGAGVVIGIGAARLLTQYLRSILFDVTPADAASVAIAAAILFLAASLAATIPAFRASRVALQSMLRDSSR